MPPIPEPSGECFVTWEHSSGRDFLVKKFWSSHNGDMWVSNGSGAPFTWEHLVKLAAESGASLRVWRPEGWVTEK